MINDTNPIRRYAIDLTGENTENFVNRESVPILNIDGYIYRVAVPSVGGFYTDHLEVRDQELNLLVPGKDYIPFYLFEDASARTGKNIYGAIVIFNHTINGKIVFSANIAGGDFAVSDTIFSEVSTALKDHYDHKPTSDELKGQGFRFREGEYKQKLWKKKGYESSSMMLEYAAREMLVGDVLAIEQADREIGEGLDMVDAEIGPTEQRVNAHATDYRNPHKDNRLNIGLSEDLRNYGAPPADLIGTEESTDGGDTGVPNDDYAATPLMLDRIQRGNGFLTHVNHLKDFNNPHKVTIEALKGYSKEKILSLISAYLTKDGSVENANAIDGLDINSLKSTVQAHLHTRLFTSGYFLPSLLGRGTASENHVLRGDGTWVHVRDLLDRYNASQLSMYVEHDTKWASNVSDILNKYQNPIAYPDGTMIAWRETQTLSIWDGDITAQPETVELTRYAVRRDGQWKYANRWNTYDLGVDRFRFEEPGVYDLDIVPGEYSVLGIGGGGGGVGYYPKAQYRDVILPFPTTECPVRGAGGGSGYIKNYRVVVKNGDKVQVRIGHGGNGHETTAGAGEPTMLIINGQPLITCLPGKGATSTQFTAIGGDGGVGAGGSSIDYRGILDLERDKDGNEYINVQTASVDTETRMISTKYFTVNSGEVCEPYVLVGGWSQEKYRHGFSGTKPLGDNGDIVGYLEEWKDFQNGKTVTYRGYFSCAGGGCGLGDIYFGKVLTVKNKSYRSSGTGYGAGGGPLQPGVPGFMSIIRVRKEDETGVTHAIEYGI